MGSQGWRVPLAILGGTGWGWLLIIPIGHQIRLNPGLFPTWQILGLVAIAAVLLALDSWAVVALINVFLSDKDSDKEQVLDDQGRPL